VWHCSLASYCIIIAITLGCAAVVCWAREAPDVKAMGKFFFIQFFVASVVDHTFDLLYVGTALLQVCCASLELRENKKRRVSSTTSIFSPLILLSMRPLFAHRRVSIR
jgi:hypothetical protein